MADKFVLICIVSRAGTGFFEWSDDVSCKSVSRPLQGVSSDCLSIDVRTFTILLGAAAWPALCIVNQDAPVQGRI